MRLEGKRWSSARMRSVVWLGTGALLMLPGCGGGSDDKGKITQVVKVTDANPKAWCDTKYVTSKFIASVGGEPKCLKTFVPGKNLKINSIAIHGSTAVVRATDNSGSGIANLIKQGGAWKIDSAKSG